MTVSIDATNAAFTYNQPNYVGELFQLTPTETPLLTMIGGLTGGISSNSEEFTWQTEDLPATGAITGIVEGADPVIAKRSRSTVSNVCQIVQKGVQVTYTKAAATGSLSTPTLRAADYSSSIFPAGAAKLGTQPVQNELSHQIMLRTMEAAREVEYSFIQGTYVRPTSNATGRETRGILEAITSNAVAASSAALSSTLFNDLVKDMADNGSTFRNPVVMVNSLNKQRMTAAFTYAPESRNVGGVNLTMLETDFAEFGVVYNRHVPADTLLIVDVSFCAPVFLEIPGKGHFFVEEMPSSGAYWEYQLYGEIGLMYGPEKEHGKITGLATS